MRRDKWPSTPRNAAGVDLSMCLRCDAPTGAYVAVLDEKGELVSAVNDMRILKNLKSGYVKSHDAALAESKIHCR